MTFDTNGWLFTARAPLLDPRQPFEFAFEAYPQVCAAISVREGLLQVAIDTQLSLDVFDEVAAVATADRIVDRLAYELRIPFGSIHLAGSHIKSGRATASILGRATLVRSVPDERLLRGLAASGWGSEPDAVAAGYHLHHEAMRSEDSIARFLLLWSLLVMLEGDEPKADAAVRLENPGVALVSSRRRHREISIVMDTRDEVAHMVQRPTHRPTPSVTLLRSSVDDATPYLMSTVHGSLAKLRAGNSAC